MTIHWTPQFGHQDLKILKRSEVFSGYSKIHHFQIQHPLFDGGMGQTLFRELIIRPDAVGVLLYDPEQDKIVMIEQFRMGAIEDPDGPWVLEIPAGLTEADESLEQTVYREVKEETGCDVLSVVPILSYLTSPGIVNEKIHLYCAKVVAPPDGKSYGVVAEGEDIKVCVLKMEEVFELLDQHRIISSPSVIAIQWLKMNRSTLHFPQ